MTPLFTPDPNGRLPRHSYVPMPEADRRWNAHLGAQPDTLDACQQPGIFGKAKGLCAMPADDEVHRYDAKPSFARMDEVLPDYVMPAAGRECNWFWGSHGCALEADHEGDHVCATQDSNGFTDDDPVWWAICCTCPQGSPALFRSTREHP